MFSVFNVSLFAHVEHYKNLETLEYELFRNNKLIGFHKFQFLRNQDLLTVKSKIEFKIMKLGVELYSYKSESEENYKNSEFLSFKSKTNQNKKIKYVNIEKKDSNSLNVDGSSYKGSTSSDNIVGTWWNHKIVKSKAQISAISGRIIEHKVTFIGKENIKIGNRNFEALHFNFSSSNVNLPKNKKMNTDIWYDEKTSLWLKASFDKSGHWEYRLKH
jgi:hypothetical protein|tara:strand:+ start:114 stop:761 length:648 start_codon:yes stop_codon:yes gene_type:complete